MIVSKECTLSPTERHIALTLSMWMNGEGGSAHPGGKLLKESTGLTLRTIRTGISKILEKGYLSEVVHGGSPNGSRRIASEYRAEFPTTGETDAPVNPLHRCNTQQGPVQMTTSTGETDAPQDVDPNAYKKARGQLSTAEFVARYGDCKHEATFVERAVGYFGDPLDRVDAIAAWRAEHPQLDTVGARHEG